MLYHPCFFLFFTQLYFLIILQGALHIIRTCRLVATDFNKKRRVELQTHFADKPPLMIGER